MNEEGGDNRVGCGEAGRGGGGAKEGGCVLPITLQRMLMIAVD